MKCGFVCVHVCVFGIDKEASVKRTRMTEEKKEKKERRSIKLKEKELLPYSRFQPVRGLKGIRNNDAREKVYWHPPPPTAYYYCIRTRLLMF